MYTVMLASECAPVAKVGGLGDVVFGLSRELEIRGNSVEIILPKYNNMRYDHIWGLTKCYENLWVPWFGGAIKNTPVQRPRPPAMRPHSSQTPAGCTHRPPNSRLPRVE